MVLDLKAKLQKTKDATWVAGEAAEAAETASYESGVLDTETRLAEEVAGVCRDYCTRYGQKLSIGQESLPLLS